MFKLFRLINSVQFVHLFVIFCSVFVAYHPALDADLVFDDQAAIVQNADIRPETNWLNLFKNDYWGTKLNSVSPN